MSAATLRSLDLNLLVALDALLTEQSVTRAAQRNGVSQPAMSQALARLRTAFDDPLLVRAGRGMAPTALAEDLGSPLHRLLSQLDNLLRERGNFTPATSTRTFRIQCLDHFSALHLPQIAAAIGQQAPDVGIVAERLSYDTLADDLERGTTDLVIGVFRDAPAGQMQRTLHEDHFVCLLRSGHPALERWGLDEFVSWPHGLISTTGRGGGAIDYFLRQHDRERRVSVRVPHFLAAGALAEDTDLVFTMAERLALSFVTRFDVVCVDLPIPVPSFSVVMRWHRRDHEDPAHRWFRDHLAHSAR